MNTTASAVDYVAAFKKSMCGVPTDLCCVAFNSIHSGHNWRSCTKGHMLDQVTKWVQGDAWNAKLLDSNLADRYKHFGRRLAELSAARLGARDAAAKREEERFEARMERERKEEVAEAKRLRFLREAKDLVRDANRGSDKADSDDRTGLIAWMMETLKTKGSVA